MRADCHTDICHVSFVFPSYIFESEAFVWRKTRSLTGEKVRQALAAAEENVVEQKKTGNEWKIVGWIALATAVFLFGAFTVRESLKKHPPKALHTPLPQPTSAELQEE